MKINISTLGLMLAAGMAAAPAAQAEWNIRSNIYMEVEKFSGHKDTQGNSVNDKVNTIGQLFLSNPASAWSYFIEHKLSMRNYTESLASTTDSFIRNRTQLGITRKIIDSEAHAFSLNFTYRKESNDAATEKNARGSDVLFWLMPSGRHAITDKLNFEYWDAIYHYDRFVGENDYEWEAEHGLNYKINDTSNAKLFVYTDWTWNNDGDKTWEQNQIRGYFPNKLNETWSVMPYFRYWLSEKNYDTAGNTTNKTESGYRLGIQVDYALTQATALWGGFAYEETDWQEAKGSGLTHGNDNTQTFYLWQLGVKHLW